MIYETIYSTADNSVSYRLSVQSEGSSVGTDIPFESDLLDLLFVGLRAPELFELSPVGMPFTALGICAELLETLL